MHERITLLVRYKVILPESADSLCYVAEILDIWLNPPIPVVLLQQLMLIEEASKWISMLNFELKGGLQTLSRIYTYDDSSPCLRT